MKKKRFYCGADPRSVEAGAGWGPGRGSDPEGSNQRADVLSLEGEVCRSGSGSSAADGAVKGREPAPEAIGGRPDTRQDDVAGCALKKW